MTRESFMKALHIILMDSMDVAKKRKLTSTQYSGKTTLSLEDQLLLLSKIQEVEGCSAEQAGSIYEKKREEAFRQKALGPKAHFSLGVVLVVLVYGIGAWFADAVFDTDTIYFLIYPLCLLLLALVWRLFTSRTRLMKKAWKAHKATGDDLLQGVEKLTEIYEKPFLKVAGVKAFVPLALCAAALLALMVPHVLPDPLYKQLPNYIPSFSSEDPNELNFAVELLQPLGAEKAERTLTKALGTAYDPTRVILSYAELGNRLAEADAISKDFAHEWDLQAVNTLDPTYIGGDFEAEWLLNLLKRLDKSDADRLINRFVTEYSNETSQTAIGHYCAQTKTIEEVLELSASLGNEFFLQAALADADAEKLEQYLTELDDPQQRLAMIQQAALRYTQPNDVLALLRMAAENGLKPTDCYPDGAALDWDLTQLDPYSEAGKIGVCAKWLPVSINEKPEPFEIETVPSELRSLSEDFESVFADDYEGNDALGKAAFEVVLDTAMMDSMPAEAIPQTIEELDSLLASSNLYTRSGTRRQTTARGDELLSLHDVQTQKDYPLYAAVQTITLYDMQSMKAVYHFSANTVSAPEAPEDIRDYENKSYYLGTPDEAWMAQKRAALIDLLDDSSWDMNMAITTDVLAQLSELSQ